MEYNINHVKHHYHLKSQHESLSAFAGMHFFTILKKYTALTPEVCSDGTDNRILTHCALEATCTHTSNPDILGR